MIKRFLIFLIGITLGLTLFTAISVRAEAATTHKYCLSAAAKRPMYVYPKGSSNVESSIRVTPGRCATITGDNSKVRLAIKDTERKYYQQAINGGNYNSCRTAPKFADPTNTFNSKGLWIRPAKYKDDGDKDKNCETVV